LRRPAALIDRTARQLGIPRRSRITLSYDAMFEEWRRRTGSSAEEMTFKAGGGGRKILRQ
jgi:hypothetical protein